MAGTAGTRDSEDMGRPIPIDLTPSRTVEVEAALVARGFGLDPVDFRQLMERRQITLLCERGTGEHAGLYRATFYHQGKRVRLVVDKDGQPVDCS